jgi:uncharacterized protein (TIGR02099 family)
MSRWVGYVGAGLMVVLALAFLAARLWLPTLADRKATIEHLLSERSAHTVRIDNLRPYWEGLHPALELQGLKVYVAGRSGPVLQLPETRISFAWLPLLRGKIESHNLTLVRPDLSLQRSPDGRFKFTGFDTPAPAGSAETGEFIHWLFSQKELVVEDAGFHWIDDLGKEPALDIKQVNIRLRNSGERHRLGISAAFPREICGECSFIVDIQGNPLTREAWGGKIYLRAHNLDLKALPFIVREQLPLPLQGLFDVELWSQWKLGQPRAVSGKIRMAELRLPHSLLPGIQTGKAAKFIRIKEASADLNWERTEEEWRLGLTNLMLLPNKKPWLAGRFHIESKPNQSIFQLEHLDLDELMWLSAGLEEQEGLAKAMDVVRTLDPKGMLNNIRLRTEGPLSSPEDYAFEADAANLKVSPYRNFPAFSGANGHVSSTKTEGAFAFNITSGSLFPRALFRAPLEVRRTSGHLNWEKYDNGWRLSGRELKLQAKEGKVQGNFSVELPTDINIVPLLSLHVKAQDTSFADSYPLLAERIMPWLRKTVLSGTLTRGEVNFEGPVRATKAGRGKLQFAGHVSHGVVQYLSKWAPLENVEAEVFVGGEEMVVTGKGKIHQLDANQVVARVSDLYTAKRVIRVTGNVAGPVNAALAVLRETGKWPALLPTGLQGAGNGSLGLDITAPLSNPQALRLAGDYHFFSADLRLPWQNLVLDHIQGNVAFTESGASSGHLQAQLLGGDTKVEIVSQNPQPLATTLIRMTGSITGVGLEKAFGPTARAFTGNAPWTATLQLSKQQNDVQLDADLQNMAITLPPPLDKPVGKPMKLALKTETRGPGNQVLGLVVGDRISAKFGLERQPATWSLTKARVNIGSGNDELPDKPERHLHMGLPYFDADRWLNYIKSQPARGTKPAVLPDIFTRISADVGTLDVLHRRYGKLSADLTKEASGWNGTLKGTALAGQIYLPLSNAEPLIQLNLDYLILPEKLPGATSSFGDPRALPTVSIRSQSFQAGKWQLGKLSFWAAPVEQGWKIRHLVLSRPEMNLFLKGDWSINRGQQATNLEAELSSSDVGLTLTAFGVPNQVVGGEAELKASLAWDGAPADFSFANLNGKIALSAEDGRFLNVKQGAGKLLGVLDIRSITRYLTLDFSNIFGKGFAFDTVEGDIVIERGNARTSGITVEGPSADIHIGGRAGIVAEDFDLEVSVSPRLGGLTTGGWWLGGPVGAAGMWLIQKLLKKEIAQGTRLVYHVKGPWQNPTIQKTIKEPGQ